MFSAISYLNDLKGQAWYFTLKGLFQDCFWLNRTVKIWTHAAGQRIFSCCGSKICGFKS